MVVGVTSKGSQQMSHKFGLGDLVEPFEWASKSWFFVSFTWVNYCNYSDNIECNDYSPFHPSVALLIAESPLGWKISHFYWILEILFDCWIKCYNTIALNLVLTMLHHNITLI